MVLRYRGGDILNFRGDLLALGHFSDVKPLVGPLALLDWRCNASISRLWKNVGDLFRFGRMTLVATQGKVPAGGVLVAGLGPKELFTADLRREIYRQVLISASGLRASSLAMEVLAVGEGLDVDAVTDFVDTARSTARSGPASVSLFVGDPEVLSRLRTVPEQEEGAAVSSQAAGE